MPATVANDEHARETWFEVTSFLAPAGILDKVDRYALEILALTFADYHRARVAYLREPLVAGSQGQPVRSPWYDAMTAARVEFRKQANEFGLTPAARVRLGAIGSSSEPESALDRILRESDDENG
jgi:P27 family predicted phage terminase small subunit